MWQAIWADLRRRQRMTKKTEKYVEMARQEASSFTGLVPAALLPPSSSPRIDSMAPEEVVLYMYCTSSTE
jgi:hypothetical protein